MIDHTGIFPLHCELLKEDGTVCGKGCKTHVLMKEHIMNNHTDKNSQKYKDFRESDNQPRREKRTKDNEERAAFIEENGGTPSEFGHIEGRNPLWRINDNGDLRRFTYAEAGSVCETYLLAIAGNHTDITGLESEAQRYIEEQGMPHGVRLHKKVGAGSRLPGSETVHEKNDHENGTQIIYSLAMTLVEIHDPVFADEVDPNDPTPTIPRLLSATVIGRNKEGIPKTFEIEQYKVKKVRDALLKSTKNQDTNKDCVQEPPTKKQKTAATQLVP
ncbi:hypothetical protein T484DRAFT_1858887 [Baffinella frigidus]|nr:hypothetical protein T484DRAFT_1858887 [Cryptophyta sp. CCMP2293]